METSCFCSRWPVASRYENNHFDPATLVNIIKVTHQNGMLAIDEDIGDVKREFKYTFFSTKQAKGEALFDWIERIIALQDRDKDICTSIQTMTLVPIISQLFLKKTMLL